MPFETFYAKFQICARYNRWSRSKQLAFLSASLTGEAGQVLWDCDASITSSLSKLTQLLKSRFGGTARADKFRMELRSRIRQPAETLEKLHQDIRRCMALAFSDVDAKARERLACDYFIGALNDPDFSLKVRERNPKTLDEALFAAQQIEVWLKDALKARHAGEEEIHRRRDRHVRGTTWISDDVVDKLMQRFDKSLQALQSRVAQLEESKRDTVSAPKLDSKPQGSNRPSSGKTKEFRCYECHEPGYIARNCPKRSGQQRPARGNETSTVGPEEAAATAQPPVRGLSNDNRSVYLPVRIKRSRLQCTLDTGSDVTVVPLRLVRKFNLKVTNSPMEQLKAANGTGIAIEGVAEVPLVVAGQLVRTDALVSRDIFEFIIGSDWLAAYHCNWDFRNSSISVNGGE